MGNELRHPGVQTSVSADSEPRSLLAVAWAESIAIRGYSRTTVRHLLESSGISRSAFYGSFGGKDEAFVAIYTDALASLGMRVALAAATEPTWSRKVAAGLGVALRSAANRPEEAWLLVGDPFGAGPRAGYCHELLLARFAPGLAAGRCAAPTPPLPATLETALLGSLIGIVSGRVRAGATATLPTLRFSLTEFVLAPYLGAERARRIACAPSAEAP